MIAIALTSQAPESSGLTGAWISFGLYLIAMIAIGLWAARRSENTEEDYFLGGRLLTPFAMALSAVSSGRSAWLVLGAATAAWKLGLAAVWYFPGYILAEALLFVTVGPRLRSLAARTDAVTIAEVIERGARGRDGAEGSSRIPLRALAGLLTVVFLSTYVSAQLVGGGKALQVVFGVEGNTTGLVISAGVVLIYTVLGGYRAVVVTDVVQALCMLAGLLVVPCLALWEVGGPGDLLVRLREIDPQLLLWTRGGWALLGGLAIGLGSPGNPHILVRHISLREGAAPRAALAWGTGWNILMAGGALLMGLAGRALYSEAAAFPGGDTDFLFPMLSSAMSAKYLFAGFAGVLLATLFAAIMSTCDSQLLVISSAIVRDLRPRSLAGRGGEGVAASRLTVCAALVVAVALSFGSQRYIDPFVLLSWGALGAAFGPVILSLLYDRRATAHGLFAAMLVGALSFVALNQLWPSPFGTTGNLHLFPAYALALFAAWPLRTGT